MSRPQEDGFRGVVLDTAITFTLHEFCRACGTQQSVVLEMVAEGVIEPVAPADDWQFHGEALVRARRALRLMHDLGVNLPGAALALDLLEELEQPEARVSIPPADR